MTALPAPQPWGEIVGRGAAAGSPLSRKVGAVTLDDLLPVPRVVTIGTFDGVHLGHQHLLRSVVARGRERSLATLVVTFEPPPPLVLRPELFRGRLCTVADKLEQIAVSGIDETAIVTFDRALAAWSPEEFMERLSATTRLRELWVGDDFALGRNRVGDVARLTEIGRRLGYDVVALPRIAIGDEEISSSAIRAAILSGDAGKARRLLGRPFRVAGEVIHGKHLGRTIGFPTANVVPPPELVPLADGIYASWALLPGDVSPRPAMTYIGTRPIVNPGPRMVETHLLDFDGDLYGLLLRVDVLERLRGDATFESLPAMVAQLRQDERDTRQVLARVEHEQPARLPG